MNVLTGLVIGAAVLFGLGRARVASRRAARASVPRTETFLPATMRPLTVRVGTGSDSTLSIPSARINPGVRKRHLLDAVQSARETDPTGRMMNIMFGPGVCTPPPAKDEASRK